MSFDLGAGLTSTLTNIGNVVTAGTNGFNTASNLSSVFSAALESGDIAKAIRSINLPASGEAIGDILGAISAFTEDTHANDWRVRLSLANWISFKSSPVLKPLKDAGGLIFPYTPRINIHSGATYSPVSPIHSNYTFQAFKNSDPGAITITAPMYVSDPTEGLYWIAMVHYLRSLTKMFVGNDPKAGNPPPVIMLNGYGNYVFKNVPVVVTTMDITLDDKSDYIGVPVVGSAAGGVQGTADAVGGLLDSLGGAFGSALGGSVGSATSILSSLAGGVGNVAGLLGTFGIGGTMSGGISHVPTKSTFTVKLQPIYSRNSARKFSLDRFVTGGYLNNTFGYV